MLASLFIFKRLVKNHLENILDSITEKEIDYHTFGKFAIWKILNELINNESLLNQRISDHTQHAHLVPPHIEDDVQLFRSEVLHSPAIHRGNRTRPRPRPGKYMAR